MKMTIEMGQGFANTVRELGSMGQNLIDAVSSGLGKGVKIAAGNVVADYLSGQALKRRTGNLARAVDGWMAGPLDGVVGAVDDAAVKKYSWLLTDEQMTITPKRSKFLVIPIGENLTSTGVARFSSPRQVPDGFFFKSKAGKLIFARRNGKKGKIRPLFVLVKSVFVQGSVALYEGVLESLDDITEAIQIEIDDKVGD